MSPILKVCFFEYGCLDRSPVMARKSPRVFLLAVYINFDHCSLLDTTSVIVSMILAAKRWELRYGLKSEHRKALWKMESYPLICSVTLSPVLSSRLRPQIYSILDWLSYFKRKKALWHTLETISHFLISLVVTSVTAIPIYGRINFTYGKIF